MTKPRTWTIDIGVMEVVPENCAPDSGDIKVIAVDDFRQGMSDNAALFAAETANAKLAAIRKGNS